MIAHIGVITGIAQKPTTAVPIPMSPACPIIVPYTINPRAHPTHTIKDIKKEIIPFGVLKDLIHSHTILKNTIKLCPIHLKNFIISSH